MQPTLNTLANGLRVILVPCEAESIAFGLFVASGSRHETPETAGISHFIEHMLFKGTPTRKPIDISRAIEGRGGNFNACTSEESTGYYAHLPSEYLADAIDILADMYLHAEFPKDEFDREKGVVIEEIRMYADDPDSVAAENVQRGVFPNHPLGAPVAGSAESLGPMRPTDLKRYVRTHYLPSNTVAVLVGDFDSNRALRLVSTALGRFRRSGTPPSSGLAPFGALTPRVEVRRDVHQAQIAIGYRAFGCHDERIYAAGLLDAVLGRGMSSRLFQEVREKRGLSYDISSRMQFFDDSGMFGIAAGLDVRNVRLALKTIDRELARVCEHDVGAAELKRTKEFLIGNFRLTKERMVAKLFFYASSFLAYRRLVLPNEQVDGIARVTAAELRTTARAIFGSGERCLSLVLPKEAS